MTRPQARSAALFLLIGLILYAAVFGAAERLVYRTGKTNPFFKIATADAENYDWVVLGASHAMPLAFDDFNALMERETQSRIINLASPGTGPLYNRFVLEQFLERHNAKNLLYVVDSFAFYFPSWNEDRFTDAKLLSRTPLDAQLMKRFWAYCWKDGVDGRALLDYATGFTKINNRERFDIDVWEGEKQFERVYRPSATATRQRIAYLYPKTPSDADRSRYLSVFRSLIALAQERNIRVVAIKLPAPSQFVSQRPDEAAFDSAIKPLLDENHVSLYDFSSSMDDPKFYFDTDHLNHAGVQEFFERYLKAILVAGKQTQTTSR
jgi:hypothetical protein